MVRSAIFILLMTFQSGRAEPPELFRQKSFTAATFAEAVNHFVALGEDVAIRELRSLAIERYKDYGGHDGQWSTNERIGWMCRVLFDPKDKQPLHQLLLGAPHLPYRTMPLSNWPRFPVALSGSTYFVLGKGRTLFGVPEDPQEYIDYCRRSGVFRKTQVPVPTRAQALQDAAALRKSKAWRDIKWEDSGEDWSYGYDEGDAWKFIQEQAESIR